jgi:hypothetical protein
VARSIEALVSVMISRGITGMMMPKPIVSISTVRKMKKRVCLSGVRCVMLSLGSRQSLFLLQGSD